MALNVQFCEQGMSQKEIGDRKYKNKDKYLLSWKKLFLMNLKVMA